MVETVLGLLRHGQTDWNIDFRLQGVTDTPLNETGIAQAKDAAAAINPDHWDAVITSPLIRAKVTAEIVADKNNFSQPDVEPLLIERSFGEAEGLMHDQWVARYSNTNEVPGGESLADLEQRANLLLSTLATSHRGKRVIAVSHGALIRVLLRIASDGEFPREGERLGNACLNVLFHDDQRWQVRSYEPRTLHLDLIKEQL
jgi:broad specificity phosphatase PhoE